MKLLGFSVESLWFRPRHKAGGLGFAVYCGGTMKRTTRSRTVRGYKLSGKASIARGPSVNTTNTIADLYKALKAGFGTIERELRGGRKLQYLVQKCDDVDGCYHMIIGTCDPETPKQALRDVTTGVIIPPKIDNSYPFRSTHLIIKPMPGDAARLLVEHCEGISASIMQEIFCTALRSYYKQQGKEFKYIVKSVPHLYVPELRIKSHKDQRTIDFLRGAQMVSAVLRDIKAEDFAADEGGDSPRVDVVISLEPSQKDKMGVVQRVASWAKPKRVYGRFEGKERGQDKKMTVRIPDRALQMQSELHELLTYRDELNNFKNELPDEYADFNQEVIGRMLTLIGNNAIWDYVPVDDDADEQNESISA